MDTNDTQIKMYIKELNLDTIQPNTKTFMNPDQGGSKIVVIGKPGCFAKGTKVLMFDGSIKNVEEVKIGDKVMGDDSTERNVLDLCHDFDDMYKITPVIGNSVIVNKKHILTLKHIDNHAESILDITVEDFIKRTKKFQKRYRWYRSVVNFQEAKVNDDPYYAGETLCSYKNPDYMNFQIPNNYKINSMENRLRLLAGMVDASGYYDVQSNIFEFIHKNENLVDDFMFVARSVGMSAYKKTLKQCEGFGIDLYYRCVLSNLIPNIPTKFDYKPNENLQKKLLSNFSIKKVKHGEYFGFELDGNHRFLLEDCSVVHNTGKSTLIASIMYHKRNIFPCGMVVSGTEDSNGFYKKIFPNTFIFNKYDEDQLKQFVSRQKIVKKHLPNPWALCLLDDCTDTPGIFNKPIQQGFFKNGRHWKMLYILSLQYCMDVKPVIRTNIDGTFILREPNLKNRRSLWENYAGVIPDFTQFCDIMDQLTDDYTALYINNATKSNKIEDCLFWYKAKHANIEFKFGAPEIWEFHEARYNKDYVDPFV